MKPRLILLSVFNTIDTFSTLYLVQALGLDEANPVCRFLLGISPVLFLAVKLVGFNLVLLYLWRVGGTQARTDWNVGSVRCLRAFGGVSRLYFLHSVSFEFDFLTLFF
jgi:hypothetical protein